MDNLLMMGRHQVPHTKKIQNYLFSLSDMLGKGNFSKVYKAVNEVTGQVVAVKVVELSSMRTPALVQLLYSEIEILKTLNHNNILNCLEVFTSANNCYIITEVCNEGDLETKLRKSGHIDESHCRKFFFDVYQGLKYLAEQNIVHRDLKVANIFLKNGIAKIADFGFAKRTSEHFKDINIGSPIYMSPEGLLEGIYGPKTDVWAFGVFLYEMTEGDTPLGFCKTQSDLKYHIQIPMTYDRFRRPLPAQLKNLILRCLDVSQQRRIGMKDIQHHPYMRSLFSQFTREGISQEGLLNSVTPRNVMQISQRPYSPANPRTLPMPQPQSQQPRGRSVDQSFNRNKPIQIRQVSPNHNVSQNKTSNTIVKALSPHVTNQNISSPSIQTRSNQHVSNHLKQPRTSQDILVCKLKFQEAVYLLHYCRLIYKCIKQMNNYKGASYPSFNYTRDSMISWLLSILDQVRGKISSHIQFEGSKALQREQKMRDVVNEYYQKYNRQLKRNSENECSLNGFNEEIIFGLKEFNRLLESYDDPSIHSLANYLITIYQSNRALENCIESKNYRVLMEKVNIEAFLNMPNKNTNSCEGISIKQHVSNICQGNPRERDSNL